MAFADTSEFAPELPNQWRVPGKPLVIAIGPRFAARLEHASASASPKSGGLLLGQVHAGQTERLILTDCVPLQWDRTQGGASFLTAAQREHMECVLSARAPEDSGPQIVGWYRAASPGESTLSREDAALGERYFSGTANVAIRAGYQSSGFHASVFANPLGTSPDLALPLHRFKGPVSPPVGSASPSRLWLRAAVAFLSLALLALASRRWAPESGWTNEFVSMRPDIVVSAIAMPSSPLGLSASPSANNFLITWNAATPALRNAVCGSLSISESGRERTVDLSPSELRSGHYSHRATNGDVDVRMDVMTRDSRLLTGTVRYIDGAKPARYAPASARFAIRIESAGEPDENAAVSKSRLCAEPPPPKPGQTPRWIAAATPLRSPTFGLPVNLALTDEKEIVIAEEVLLNEDGLVVDVKPLHSVRYAAFAAELAEQLRQWKFTPATQDRVPVATTVRLEFSIRSRM